MHTLRRIGLFLVVLGLTAACASGTRLTPVTENPQVRLRRTMDEAALALREGRTRDALDKYLEVARSPGVSPLSREACLQAGLLRLGGDASIVDFADAARLLRESRTRYERADEPLALTAALAALERLDDTEQEAAAAALREAARRDEEAARRDEEARGLRRTVASLRQQLEKRNEALRKAAEAAVGPSRR